MNGHAAEKQRREELTIIRAFFVKHRRTAAAATYLSGSVMWVGIMRTEVVLAIVGAALFAITGYARSQFGYVVEKVDVQLAELLEEEEDDE